MSEKIKTKGGLEQFKGATTNLRFQDDALSFYWRHPDKVILRDIHFFNNEDFELIVDLFGELQNYSIEIAKYKIIKRTDKVGGTGEYIITEKIKGTRLDEFLKSYSDEGESRKNFVKQLESFYTGVVSYYIDKFKSSSPFLADIYGNDQYFYSRDSGKIILIDLDPFFVKGLGENPGRRYAIFTALEWIANFLFSKDSSSLKTAFPEFNFKPIRQQLTKFVNSLPVYLDKKYKTLESLKWLLRQ